jgi:hypothetical protein
LTSQTLFYQQASNPNTGNYLAADGGVVYSDNIERSSSGSGDTLLLAGLSGDAARQGTRLDYHLACNLALVKYLSSAFPTRPAGYLDGLAALKIVPGFFSWLVRETYSQAQINIYAPVTPENLVSTNYLTTGPRFTLRPTLRTSVTLEALYSYLNSSSPSVQYTNFDNHRYGGNLKINRAFSDTASLYLKGYYEKVEFKDQVNNNNFSIGSAEAGYKLVDGRTVFDVSGGYSQLRVYDVLATVESPGGSRESLQTEKINEPIWKFELSRLITPRQRLALTASQQFTDAASAFRLGFHQPAPTIAPPQLASGSAYKQRGLGVDWRLEGARTTLNVSLLALRQRYPTVTANDYDQKIASALLTRKLSPVLNWNIGASYESPRQVGTQPQSVGGQSSKVLGAITNLQWQVGERLTVRFLYAYSSQRGVYTDNQIGVTASWTLLTGPPVALAFPVLSPISPASTLSH